MKRKQANFNTSDPDLKKWCAVLSAPSATVEKVPDGWHTCVDLAAKMGLSRVTLSRKLGDAIRNGRAEVKKFVITTGAVTRPVPHYRLK